MKENRVQFNTIIKNQLPSYVREEFPLISEFLSQYYLSQEYQGSPADLIQNIDHYIKLDQSSNTNDSLILSSDISFDDDVITINPTFGTTYGFPDSYGLLKIGNEIITYTGKTNFSFTGCIRGFSGISSYNFEELIFDQTTSEEHSAGDVIENLSILFLKEFLNKTKKQFSPGFDGRDFASKDIERFINDPNPDKSSVNQNIFIKQSKDFYSSKGTDQSFKILFNALYGTNVEIIKPREFLFRSSDAGYKITNDLVVESVEGDPFNLENLTLYQDSYGTITKAYAPVTKVEKLSVGVSTNEYYQISLDSGYDRDIDVSGAIYGTFSVHPKSQVIGQVSIGQTYIDVDSTIGFPSSGDLSIVYPNGQTGVITYQSKTLTEFLGCSNIVSTIPDGSVVNINTFAYSYVGIDTTNKIKVRIRSVLNSLDFNNKLYYHSAGEKIRLKTLGVSPKDNISNNWIFNTSSTFEIKDINFRSPGNYRTTLFDSHTLRLNDKIVIYGSDGSSYEFEVVNILSDKVFDADGSFIPNEDIDPNSGIKFTFKRKRLKALSDIYNINNFDANIQNTYKFGNKTLVASHSIPRYFNPLNPNILSYTLNGKFSEGDNIRIPKNTDHGFQTGDAIYYTPEKDSNGNVISSLFDEGIYYVKRVDDNNIKLSRSRSNIFNEIFVRIESDRSITNNKIELLKFKGKTLSQQKLLREVDLPLNDGKFYPTLPGQTGIFVNGVELLNYKSKDFIHYGGIDDISVIYGGTGYNVQNPPQLIISDSVGTGATGFCAVKGNLKEIRILDSGFDYLEIPYIKISGGNGRGATAQAKLTDTIHEVEFNAEEKFGIVDLTNNTLGFTTYHKFRNNEIVIYKTFGQKSISGLNTESRYYISVRNATTVSLHETFSDSNSGINTISLIGYGEGKHSLEAFSKKKIVSSIVVTNPGEGYENKRRTCSSVGINTALNTVTIKNHDYKSGEVISYFVDGSPAGGLSTTTNYYVTVLDDDTFRLSNIGLTTDNLDFFYKTKQYVDITSVGVGTHSFNYPEITVGIFGNIGISSVSEEEFRCQIQPIFEGEISSVHLSDVGVGYGSSEILNFVREPQINLFTGSGAQLYPVVSDGKIFEVLVNDGGNSYTSPPELIIEGDGTGASLTPVLTDGSITAVKIIDSGAGYTQNLTKIKIVSPGSDDIKFSIKLNTWNVNLFRKYLNILNNDDGIITEAVNKDFGLGYNHLYAPRDLRKIVYSTDSLGNTLYTEPDLKTTIDDEEIDSIQHSPIIGWSYDGNPIYGPYGYITKNGGSVTRMKSGYRLISNVLSRVDRPPFPEEFFTEDFEYIPSDQDDTVLDENNGRFCKTPDFPNGVYAYFSTFEDSLDEEGVFNGFRKPKFPYVIGKNYNSKPNLFNFDSNSNQDKYDLNTNTWLRNTYSYNFNSKNSRYDYLFFPEKFRDQLSQIKATSVGSVDSIGITTGGINYQVNDKIILNTTNTKGKKFSGKVSEVSGKEINSIVLSSTTINDVEFYPLSGDGSFIGFSSTPHGLNDFDLVKISGLSTSSSLNERTYRVGITTNKLTISGIGTTSLGISSTGITGIVTYIPISGNLNVSNIRENDILGIGSERVKVLNIDQKSSRIRVLREIDGTIGVSHTASTIIFEDSRKFVVKSGYNTSFTPVRNREYYFDPSESLGIGTISGVGIGSTIVFSNPGAGITQIFIPTRSIYLPNHNLNTGDQIAYNTNGGGSIGVSTDGITTINPTSGDNFYVAKITNDLIGISTIKVGLGTTGSFVGIASTTSNQSILYFTGIGTNTYHSFKTNYEFVLKGRVDKNTAIVSTAETHGLLTNDLVKINVNPSTAKTFSVRYNEYNRRVIVGSKTFSSGNINIFENNINISNHGFYNGQVVIYTSPSPSGGLENNKIYYVHVVTQDIIQLADTYYNATLEKPTVIDITSASEGTLSLVNPPLEVYKNSTIDFDLTDPSLSHVTSFGSSISSFDFKFFVDDNFFKEYQKIENNQLVVKKFGTPGVSTDAKVTVVTNDNTPEILFYKLVPTNLKSIPTSKKEVVVDSNVKQNNKIFIKESLYNGNYNVYVSTGSTFTYDLEKYPEKSQYTINDANLSYSTSSETAFGPIRKIEIINGGSGFDVLPGISTIISDLGSNAILEPESNSIGKIEEVKIDTIGFDYPTDFTVRPSSKIPEVLNIEPLSNIKSIGVSSAGVGYVTAPELIVLDGSTKKVLNEVDLRFDVSNNTVDILNNTKGLFDVTPIIIPTQNCNGVGISSVSYDSVTKDVTIVLSVGFTTIGGFPFSVNDKILIEGISIGAGSTNKGYNSSNYNYELFTVKTVNPNYGGSGANIIYSLDGFLLPEESPGTFDSIESIGRVIPEKQFPIFDVTLSKNNFLVGEEVKSFDGKSFGKIAKWDPITEYAVIETKDEFEEGTILIGQSSKSEALISKSISIDSSYNLNSFSRVVGGWSYDAGFISNNSQRIQDSFYYQNFSYSLKSTIDYDTWNNTVSNLNHTPGFKKFSDYQMESLLDIPSSMIVGIPTNVTDLEVKVDLIGEIDLNCVNNFDLVTENAININGKLASNQIIFENQILTDYTESIGNRVLLFDDISSQFNSNPRSTRYADVHRISSGGDIVAQKYIIYVQDTRYTDERQLSAISFIIDGKNNTYLNQYGIEGYNDLGNFDVLTDGLDSVLRFYPVKYSVNNYDISSISYSLKESLIGAGNSDFGPISVATTSIEVSSGVTTTIVGIATTYTSSKVLLEIGTPDGLFEYNEISIIHDNSDVSIVEFGRINNISDEGYVGSGLGTYSAYISGSNVNLDFIPNPGVAATVNSLRVSMTNSSSTGIGTYQMRHVLIEGRSTSIGSSTSPVAHDIAIFDEGYDAAYFIVQVSDVTNNRHQISEVLVLEEDAESITFQTEYGNLETHSGLGTIGSYHIHPVDTRLTFTPLPSIDVEVKVYMNAFKYDDPDSLPDQIDFTNAIIETDFSEYQGTSIDVKRQFGLSYENYPVFVRDFEGNNTNIVDINNNTIIIPNHFFVTGEELSYSHAGIGSTMAIGIGTTSIVGFGTTDKLPPTVFALKVDDKTIKLAATAQDALSSNPVVFDLIHVGIGTSHTLIAKNQNNKVIIALDNNIQSPIVSTSLTTTLADQVSSVDDIIFFTGITSFFGGDLIRIGSEILQIEGIGIGATNGIRVKRSWMGTNYAGYSTGTLVTKVNGDYNIVGNTLNFVTAPYGNVPLSTSTNRPEERDWVGISTNSKFHGRMFMRSGIPNGVGEAYHQNYIFDDISEGFTGIAKTFTLKSEGSNVTGISTGNAIVLINEIFQNVGQEYTYTLTESSGETNLEFVGFGQSLGKDIGISSFPRGGMIVSVGSSEGFGYQPLVSAGGTAIVSISGTIQSISIGNSGSGYRQIQTVNVGVATSTTGTPSIHFVGTATVSNGNIVSIAVTNPGTGYTTTNPPYVIFDAPLSYSNIPLIYSNNSVLGVGTSAFINVIVGQGSSIIDFEIQSTGYGYGQGEILTLPIGGISGIPTTSDYIPFELTVDKTVNDKFSGWSIGDLDILDDISTLFNGRRRTFSLRLAGEVVNILSAPGSYINVDYTLLIFINDILQVPEEGYTFGGGNIITFTEPPKEGDTSKIIFYKGSGIVDVEFKEIINDVEPGDTLRIQHAPSLNQSPSLDEDKRLVESVDSVNVVTTNPYYGPGNVDNPDLKRPVVWCRQTEDVFINSKIVGKSRELYEANINPSAYLIKSVGVGETVVFVDNVRPFFNPLNETDAGGSDPFVFQRDVILVSQNTIVSASATAVVSSAGTISSVVISDGGVGYTTSPIVSIAGTVGIGSTHNAFASATISGGSVVSIAITNPGFGYTTSNPPVVLIESPSIVYETNRIASYEGDYGLITGISTTSVGVASTGIVFDLLIEKDSFLRESEITGFTTISGIQTGYYFVVYNSNVGNGVTSLDSDGGVIGIGTTCLDNVYRVASVSIAQTDAIGFGVTYVAKVTVSVSDYNSLSGIGTSTFYGEYSWGKLNFSTRVGTNTYNAYTNNGVTGIVTGGHVNRTKPLRYINYIQTTYVST